ncbi:MAE_28990/MAE_18760 family HEPN-like nuclease [Alkalilimnicola ehrlichii MLHE-1]|uniref:RiboL-PSP-HEPN domain-containing protein n=1 Tax=Alkalilimnicola ehrlichii (strain ATCC BAA-1101 / DSM 17681 / MLHE-1) TaxID=187272 RepID=Q0A7P7_ALKEH|nr:MAE_28990/MAE_18760 family HEPN-like nuclease [Alkalilimnicola ehrlichii]ABI57140.1 hypothetical protein Mlg_1796 [Alkalilimnicola ehrlichii MLHE-1]
MSDVFQFLSDLDSIRLRRAKELSEIKVRMNELGSIAQFGVQSKAVIVLSYSHWEGFYNDCVSLYIDFLREARKKVSDVSWPMLIGLLQSDFQRLRDRNHSQLAAVEFILRFQEVTRGDFLNFDKEVVSSRSNLDFRKLKDNFEVMGFDCSPFLRWRLKIDNELVRWRHSIAHGDDPDLSTIDIREHVTFTQRMLLVLSDCFQNNIMNCAE